MSIRRALSLATLAAVACPADAWAADATTTPGFGLRAFWLAIILTIAGLFWLIEKRNQPAVLGELLGGVLLGNLSLLGITFFEPMKTDDVIQFLSKFGVCLLLFQIGLESNVSEMRRVGLQAFFSATSGVIATVAICGFLIGHWILPSPENSNVPSLLFLGAIFSATSASISARVLRDLKRIDTREAKIVLGASVMDDIMSLIVLAVAVAIVHSAHEPAGVDIGGIVWIAAKALLFLGGSLAAGTLLAPRISALLVRISAEHKMKLLFAFLFFLFYMAAAEWSGLDAIIGAFAAGLVLDEVHFREFRDPAIIEKIRAAGVPAAVQEDVERAAGRHIDALVASPAYILVPVFFVMTGMLVDLRTLGNGAVLGTAAVLLVGACAGKLACGIPAGRQANFWVIACSMMARGEVQLIAATMGLSAGVIQQSLFTAVILVVIMTTILVPLILSWLLRRVKTHPVGDVEPVGA